MRDRGGYPLELRVSLEIYVSYRDEAPGQSKLGLARASTRTEQATHKHLLPSLGIARLDMGECSGVNERPVDVSLPLLWIWVLIGLEPLQKQRDAILCGLLSSFVYR